jgi:SAM-dependent methyltransferase
MTKPDGAPQATRGDPWQLAMFRKGLKKRLRLKVLKRLLQPISAEERCLLLTCGDNNGAMNYFLRELGGRWSWADLEDTSIPEMSELLGEPVAHAAEDNLLFDDTSFDRIVVIDVHEHVDDPRIVTRELARILKPGAQLIITTPNGDETRLAVRIKSMVGMSVETYGHTRVGLTSGQIEELMIAAGVRPVATTSFSRFFTEMLELSINFLYVKVLRKDDRARQPEKHAAADNSERHQDHAEIAPATAEQLRKVKNSYRIYSIIFPVYWLISQLDHLLFFREGYCVVVVGQSER